MAALETSIKELRLVLGTDLAAPDWRWQVRGRLAAIKEALSDSQTGHWDGWLSARAGTSNRERHQLIGRVSALAAVVLDQLDPRMIAHEAQRLQGDLEHYVQRVHDLVYDSVALEIGGSE